MKCPFCSTLDSKVIDSRPANDGTSIRRRRECLQCHSRFTTYETVEMLPMVVIKKNGMRQSFDRSKLLSSMLKACEKRSVSLSLLEKAADDIERELQNELGGEISSTQIGELVMDKLKACPLRFGLPPIQRHQHFYGRAEQTARPKKINPLSPEQNAGPHPKHFGWGPAFYSFRIGSKASICSGGSAVISSCFQLS